MSARSRKEKRPVHRLRVFLVDEHPAVRRGLVLLLGREPDVEICGSFDHAPDPLHQLVALEADIGIVDFSPRGAEGLHLVSELRAHCPQLKIVVFSIYDNASHVRAALRAGADGYVSKEEGAERLIEAIRAVMAGKCFLTREVAARLAHAPGVAPRRSRI